eukprot:9207758-Pyramimonas_sp.AAC.1
MAVCCTLPAAEIIRDNVDEVRKLAGPQQIVAFMATRVARPRLLFAQHSIFSKVKHNVLKGLSRDDALRHWAST